MHSLFNVIDHFDPSLLKHLLCFWLFSSGDALERFLSRCRAWANPLKSRPVSSWAVCLDFCLFASSDKTLHGDNAGVLGGGGGGGIDGRGGGGGGGGGGGDTEWMEDGSRPEEVDGI